jgi:hypothetical protein
MVNEVLLHVMAPLMGLWQQESCSSLGRGAVLCCVGAGTDFWYYRNYWLYWLEVLAVYTIVTVLVPVVQVPLLQTTASASDTSTGTKLLLPVLVLVPGSREY